MKKKTEKKIKSIIYAFITGLTWFSFISKVIDAGIDPGTSWVLSGAYMFLIMFGLIIINDDKKRKKNR